jgi:carbamoyltransferase
VGEGFACLGFRSRLGKDLAAQTVNSGMIGRGRSIDTLYRRTGALRTAGGRPFSWRSFDHVEDSLGAFYSYFTELVGFGKFDEGKTMGLATYGADTIGEAVLGIVGLTGDGEIRFGAPQRSAVKALADRHRAAPGSDEDFQARADLARAAQLVLEEALLRNAVQLHQRAGLDRLCVSGGVFMNCAANYRLLTDGPFAEVFVHGASGDNGTALGAALHGHYEVTGAMRDPAAAQPVIYTGRQYGDERFLAALRSAGDELHFRRSDRVARETAGLLAGGYVVGWFQGGSEFGARALGNRSILADPRRPEMKDRINMLVKGRESFRPFAPSVLAERQSDFYDVNTDSPYMCVNAMALGGGTRIPAVTHVDGSARFQTVRRDLNPLYHELISEFDAITGVGVLLNTSFNESEPIVETPEQAVDCFLRTDIDVLVLGPYVATRTGSALP